MTGPEHYAVAESLAEQCEGREIDAFAASAIAAIAAVAQVHATLSVAAYLADLAQQREVMPSDPGNLRR